MGVSNQDGGSINLTSSHSGSFVARLSVCQVEGVADEPVISWQS